jgi:type I restriction enzyme R subunit
MNIHKEITFEQEICAHLASHGWLYADDDAANYDRDRALFPADVLAWIQQTQPQAWKAVQKLHGAQASEVLLSQLADQLGRRGCLEVMRAGIDLVGVRQPIKLAEFKPAFSINEEILARYNANRLRVVRQVRYSRQNENSIDLVLFLNGLPVATAELKSDFTQSIEDAVWQYQRDRLPRPKGGGVEPLLSFPRGALVHFAVSNSEVRMTTKLAGPETVFLPFNQGNAGGAGNPPGLDHPTAYLWQQVWQRDSWLEILGRYITADRNNAKRELTRYIFPRFHQLDATRKLQQAIRANGVGGRYLIQHSAGSGKTNSIAWTAHFLAELHDDANRKMFDSVIVVSDRNVIDAQLQDALMSFERQSGVVASITREDGSKSSALAEALSGAKKVVVCTIQTFPAVHERMRDLVKTEGKRFAVIADEAHSSQSGEAASKLKAVLTAEEQRALEDGGEISTEDLLAEQMAARADESRITFIAFTATPKPKTLELFGRRPDPTRPPADDNKPQSFHVYSMRQAIDEGFILDVLKNYISYSQAFRLTAEGTNIDSATVERSRAMKGVMGWVRLHPHNIAQRVQLVVEHYREHVAPLLDGRAKAMVVVSSRVEAVRWKLAIDKYIREKGYPIGTLVAFSGDVSDKESGPEPFSESSKSLNPGLKGNDIRGTFNDDAFQILLVANKFQTGFDQPLLCGMYVDKRLDGIQAVQTLSRLNRAMKGKDTTFVVDFVNDPADILKAFKVYYETAELAGVTKPEQLFDLFQKLDALGHYDTFDVERVVNAVVKPGATQGALQSAIAPVRQRVLGKYKAAKAARAAAVGQGDEKGAKEALDEMRALAVFRSDMATFHRIYIFLSQIYDYARTDLEKRSIFYRALVPLLDFEVEREELDLAGLQLTHHSLKYRGKQHLALGPGESPKLEPISAAGTGTVQERQKALLREIIEKVNDLFEGDLTEQDKLVYVRDVIRSKMLESNVLAEQAQSNSKEQFGSSPDLLPVARDAIIQSMDAHSAMSSQLLVGPERQEALVRLLLQLGLYEDLRAKKASA